jgi:hypothetical protein
MSSTAALCRAEGSSRPSIVVAGSPSLPAAPSEAGGTWRAATASAPASCLSPPAMDDDRTDCGPDGTYHPDVEMTQHEPHASCASFPGSVQPVPALGGRHEGRTDAQGLVEGRSVTAVGNPVQHQPRPPRWAKRERNSGARGLGQLLAWLRQEVHKAARAPSGTHRASRPVLDYRQGHSGPAGRRGLGHARNQPSRGRPRKRRAQLVRRGGRRTRPH